MNKVSPVLEGERRDAQQNEDEDERLDPRIQVELEKMNTANEEINRLERELDLANNKFQKLLSDSTEQLETTVKKLGSCIKKARPYYEALEGSRRAQIECQQAAVSYQRAYENYLAAKETILLAETRFLSEKHELEFDMAWQEMLNQATIRVMEAEKSKAVNEKEHKKRALLSAEAERKVQLLEKDLGKHIVKSRPYFVLKDQVNHQLIDQKEKVEMLKDAVIAAKRTYSQGITNLEMISEQIHEKRSMSRMSDLNVSENNTLDLTYNLDKFEEQSFKSSVFSSTGEDGDSLSLSHSADGASTPVSRISDQSSAYFSNGQESLCEQMNNLKVDEQCVVSVLPPLMFHRADKKNSRRSRSDGYLTLTSNEMYPSGPSTEGTNTQS
ncbi:SH3 domain-binding protein 5 homolog [Artemia franciscana]|uniref:SH3 domain-binding protein 5-like protein n=1 Tax=Artemia franciscana TaxID=6661 RepID=A0AA88HW99_ARTSF|nr:hypothetical protein QYM36_007234 [Artemia franciscana]